MLFIFSFWAFWNTSSPLPKFFPTTTNSFPNKLLISMNSHYTILSPVKTQFEIWLDAPWPTNFQWCLLLPVLFYLFICSFVFILSCFFLWPSICFKCFLILAFDDTTHVEHHTLFSSPPDVLIKLKSLGKSNIRSFSKGVILVKLFCVFETRWFSFHLYKINLSFLRDVVNICL